jgi:hypothetical protein
MDRRIFYRKLPMPTAILTFTINGRRVLKFVTHPGCDTSAWTIKGEGGITLSYQHVWIDHVSDAFGYFTLNYSLSFRISG